MTKRVDLGFEPDDDNIIRYAAHAFRERLPIRYVVDGVLRKKNISIWYGGTGVKKTQTALDMAVHVSQGLPWLGHNTKKGNVLIFDTENGQDELEDKIAEIVRGELGYESEDGRTFYDPETSKDVDVGVYYISIADINLMRSPELGVATMVDRIQRVQATMFILDSLDGMMVGYSDSEQVNITTILYYLRLVIGETGATPLILHNTNRKEGFRGSGAIPQGAFTMVRVESAEFSDVVHLTEEKRRRGEKTRFSCKGHWAKDDYGDDTFHMTPAEGTEIAIDLSCTKLERCVLKFLADSPDSEAWLGDVKEYGEKNSFSEGGVANALLGLLQRNFVARHQEGRRAYYAITPEGADFAGLRAKDAT